MPFPPTLANNFETGLASGTTISAANSGTAPNAGNAFDVVSIGGTAALTYDNAQAADGTLSAKCDASATASFTAVKWTTAFVANGNPTEFWVRMYVYFNPTNFLSTGLWNLFTGQLAGATAYYTYIFQSGNYFVRVLDSLSANTSGVVPIATNQWIRIEWHVICSATVGLVQAKLFNTANSLVADETITKSGGNTKTATDYIALGPDGQQGNSHVSWMDGLQVNGGNYPGPINPGLPVDPRMKFVHVRKQS